VDNWKNIEKWKNNFPGLAVGKSWKKEIFF
jgi:hypothetical protein